MFKTQIKTLFKFVILISYPFIYVTILGYFIMPHKGEYYKEVIAFGYLSLLFYSIIIIFSNTKLKKSVTTILLILLSILAFIKLSFYNNYHSKIGPSALQVIFETNSNEASGYLAGYFNSNVLIILATLSAFTIISLRYLYTIKPIIIKSKTIYGVVALPLIMVSVYNIYYEYRHENIMLTSVKSYIKYLKIKANIDANLAKQTSPYLNDVSSLESPQTYVVIIGESTTTKHMQLYGYSRATNPQLTEIKNELLIYKNVITPNTHTIIALDKILTFSDYNTPNKKKNASIIQLANEASFSTYWISNQQPAGIMESMATQIGRAAKTKYFLNTYDDKHYNTYDDILLPTIEQVLNNKQNKKILFIHLMGSHLTYKNRYPKSFNHFKSVPKKYKNENEGLQKTLNAYDNSIRFNDFIVRDIIEKTRATKTNSYVLYFSDHGEDVYDTSSDLLGHNEYMGTKPMYTTPFIIWLSDTYKNTNPQILNDSLTLERPYITEDFIHSFSEISRIKFKGLNYEKSIFSSHFKAKKRIIKQGKDYDKNE